MATAKQSRHNGATHYAHSASTHVSAAASDLLHGGKKLAKEIYKDGLSRVDAAEDTVRVASTKALKKVKENPLASVLIAAGVGFIISALFRK